jgi:hypothetical protein
MHSGPKRILSRAMSRFGPMMSLQSQRQRGSGVRHQVLGMADGNRMNVEALEEKVGTKYNNSVSLTW